MANFLKGKMTGMVMKKTQKGKTETYSKATNKDIKGMPTKDKIKFGGAIKNTINKAAKKKKMK